MVNARERKKGGGGILSEEFEKGIGGRGEAYNWNRDIRGRFRNKASLLQKVDQGI